MCCLRAWDTSQSGQACLCLNGEAPRVDRSSLDVRDTPTTTDSTISTQLTSNTSLDGHLQSQVNGVIQYGEHQIEPDPSFTNTFFAADPAFMNGFLATDIEAADDLFSADPAFSASL